MIKYIAVEKITPDVVRAWGEGETDLIAKLNCEIALREKLIGKLEAGCREAFAQTDMYIIKKEQPNPSRNWSSYIDQVTKTGLESPTPYKVIPYKNGRGIKKIELL